MPIFDLNEIYLYLFSSGFILLIFILLNLGIKNQFFDQETGRKILHIIAVLTCGVVISQTDANMVLGIILSIFSILLFYIAHKNILIPNERRSYGIAFFPLAFAILLFTPLSKDAIMFGVVTLGISDALAGWVGHNFSKQKHLFLYEYKSWTGFITFYLTTVLISFVFLGTVSSIVLILALVPALSELFSYRGSDNFSIPIIGAIWYEGLNYSFDEWYLILLMIAILWLVYNRKWLTFSGIVAAFFLAVMILCSVELMLFIPITVFFIVGSLTSKLNPKSKDSNGRDAIQVFSNGALGVLFLLLFSISDNEIFIYGYFVSICISLTDTISSDIGIYFNQKTYDILSLKPIRVGLSGGISFAGTIAGFFAAIIFSCLLWTIFDFNVNITFYICFAGMLGMFLDSFIGSAYQAKYISNQNVSEEKIEGSNLFKGLNWLNNDGVNLISNIIVSSLFLIFFLLAKL